MEIYVKKFLLLPYFSFLCFQSLFLYTLIYHMLHLQTQQVMTSQIRSHIEYLIQTSGILVLIIYSKLIRLVAAQPVFNAI